ncbi:hypothetical protein ABK040_013418 [Willaertia magna]
MAELQASHFIPKDVSELSVDYIKQVLNDEAIENIHIEKATKTMHLCNVYRMKVSYKDDKTIKHFIVKLDNTDQLHFAKLMKLYIREYNYYHNISEIFKKEQQQQENIYVTPKCYYSNLNDDETKTIVILNDFKEEGFESNGDLINGLTVEQAKLAVKALGQLHFNNWNSSFVKSDKSPNFLEIYKDTFYTTLKSLIETFVELVGKEVKEKYTKFYEKYLKAIHLENTNIEESLLLKEMKQLLEETISEEDFEKIGVTLCHGDYKTENLLFHKSEEKIAILDWQTYWKGSLLCCAFDVAHFIVNNLSVENATQFREELLTIYCKDGLKNLATVDCFKNYYKKAMYYELSMLMLIIQKYMKPTLNMPEGEEKTRRLARQHTHFERMMTQINDLLGD